MLKKWTWLIPCWVWLWWFDRSGKGIVWVDNGDGKVEGYDGVRIDNDFILVKMPTKRWKAKSR